MYCGCAYDTFVLPERRKKAVIYKSVIEGNGLINKAQKIKKNITGQSLKQKDASCLTLRRREWQAVSQLLGDSAILMNKCSRIR